MRKNLLLNFLFVSFVVHSAAFSSQAASPGILQTAEEFYFDPQKMPPVGIEIEFSGLTLDRTMQILVEHLGGKAKVHSGYLFEITDKKTGEKSLVPVPAYKLNRSVIKGQKPEDKIMVKIEPNGFDVENLHDKLKTANIIEIVTPPILWNEILELDKAVRALRREGATGTSDGLAVSIQVNYPFVKDGVLEATPIRVINMARNYLKPQHLEKIQNELGVAEQRRGYVGEFSPGMTKTILNPGYNPSWREFYDDFMYRQTAEVFGLENAFDLPIEKVRAEVLEQLGHKSYESILPVVKWNSVRLSSLLLMAFPEDPLSKWVVATRWARPAPISEFRDADNNFDLKGTVSSLAGFVQMSDRLGDFNFEELSKNGRLSKEEMKRTLSRKATPKTCSSIFW